MSGRRPRKNHQRSSGLRGTSTSLLDLGRNDCRITSKPCIGGHLSHYAKMRLGQKRRKLNTHEPRISGCAAAEAETTESALKVFPARSMMLRFWWYLGITNRNFDYCPF